MYGLVLEGGGGKGAYQIGACMALKDMGITFRGVAGTSVGALNGAMLVQGDLEKAYEIWYDLDPSKVVRLTEDEAGKNSGPDNKGRAFDIKLSQVKRIILERGLDIRPLEEIVSKMVDEGRIRSSGLDFGIVTYDLTGRKAVEIFLEDIPDGKLCDYLIASASLPGFKLKSIDGRLFIDGGVYNCLPINLLKDRGYKDIIVIRTFGAGREKKVDTSGLNLTYITPSENLGAMLDFSREKARKNLKLGYYDALKVFRGLKGKSYYIEPLSDENFFVKYLADIDEDRIRKVAELFGIEGYSLKRALFENIIPRLANLLGLRQGNSYEDISIALIERMAQAAGLERFRIYTFRDIFREISLNYRPSRAEFLKEIPGFIKRMDLVGKIVRDRIIECITEVLFEDIIDSSVRRPY